MINIRIGTVAHSHQRYDTVGDWHGNTPGNTSIVVSELSDWRYEFLVGLHELVEATLCQARGVTDEAVTAFDKEYIGDDEPGDDPRAPYFNEHMFATAVERMVASELGVSWDDYDAALKELSQ